MATALALGSGLFWTLTYVLIIRRGIADRTYGMPIVALCANLSWELIFSVVRPADGVQLYLNVVWLLLDIAILGTIVRYGPRHFPYLPRWAFLLGLAGTLVLSYLAVDLISTELNGGRSTYAAYAQNLLMSALFLAMLAARRDLSGQSAWIAAAKLVGTVLASLRTAFYTDYQGSGLLRYLFLTILLLDLAYLVAVVMVGRAHRGRTDGGGTPVKALRTPEEIGARQR